MGDPGLILALGTSPGAGKGDPLQYSCLENSMDREAWWATVHGVAELDMTKRPTLTHSLMCISKLIWWKRWTQDLDSGPCHDPATIKQRSFMLFYCKGECNILNQHRFLPYSLGFASHLKSIRKKNIGLHPSWQLENKQVKMDTLRVCINKGTIILGMKKRHAEQLSVFKWIVLWCKLVHSALMKWIL